MSEVAHWTLFALFSLIIYGVQIPILLYYARKFYIYQHIDLISKRMPTLILSFAVVGSILHSR